MSKPVVTLSLRLPPLLAEQMEQEAHRRAMSKTSWVIEAVGTALARSFGAQLQSKPFSDSDASLSQVPTP